MKGIIPAAGLGTRLRPLTFTRPKPVLRVAGKPIIVHAIETLQTAGINEIAVIVSDLTRTEIEYTLRSVSGCQITLIDQHEQLGLGHAVGMACEWAAGGDVCVYLGDNLFEFGINSYVEQFNAERPDALIALVEVADPSAFGVARVNQGHIVELVEKPKEPVSNLAVAGAYFFSSRIFQALRDLPPSARGEYEITDAIQRLIREGATVLGQRVQGWWKDTGRPSDLLDANRLLLERLETNIEGQVSGSRLSGRVHLPASSRVLSSKIVGPVMIGEDVVIEDAYIGPFTSIGRGSVIKHAEVEHSVLEAFVRIESVDVRLQDCLIGLRARVSGGRRIPRTLKLTLSDASEVELT
ncbi:glucose-1-phosphate thymidylyltransferase [Deinococcus irradiatisoli]|uniref:Glucose-1-phosphate thymidylyltransferase n=1 Tax=Deinococcus irradiatisoli TaxID=2202254 RepID=A0A2Z3JMW2_9DEIO|nr:glucose-1-phosphate thymidylyltransferase [Deinococcus irradiatisoli]AWN23008.1 glucose-1-phosphate thymidylyltransferase [Deinococcus irradiatisoli]